MGQITIPQSTWQLSASPRQSTYQSQPKTLRRRQTQLLAGHTHQQQN